MKDRSRWLSSRSLVSSRARRGRARMLRPQVATRQRDGWCGSQPDDPRLLPPLLPASPVTRETTESHPLQPRTAGYSRQRRGCATVHLRRESFGTVRWRVQASGRAAGSHRRLRGRGHPAGHKRATVTVSTRPRLAGPDPSVPRWLTATAVGCTVCKQGVVGVPVRARSRTEPSASAVTHGNEPSQRRSWSRRIRTSPSQAADVARQIGRSGAAEGATPGLAEQTMS